MPQKCRFLFCGDVLYWLPAPRVYLVPAHTSRRLGGFSGWRSRWRLSGWSTRTVTVTSPLFDFYWSVIRLYDCFSHPNLNHSGSLRSQPRLGEGVLSRVFFVMFPAAAARETRRPPECPQMKTPFSKEHGGPIGISTKTATWGLFIRRLPRKSSGQEQGVNILGVLRYQ